MDAAADPDCGERSPPTCHMACSTVAGGVAGGKAGFVKNATCLSLKVAMQGDPRIWNQAMTFAAENDMLFFNAVGRLLGPGSEGTPGLFHDVTTHLEFSIVNWELPSPSRTQARQTQRDLSNGGSGASETAYVQDQRAHAGPQTMVLSAHLYQPLPQLTPTVPWEILWPTQKRGETLHFLFPGQGLLTEGEV